MALNSQNQILASDFVSLKARVKAEMNRRRYSGSLTSYAGTAYDYTENPTSGGVIKPEHANKLIIPVNAITPSGYTEKALEMLCLKWKHSMLNCRLMKHIL